MTRTTSFGVIGVAVAAAAITPSGVSAQQEDERQTFPQVDTMSPHGVDMQTGRFIERGVDMQMGPIAVDHYISSKLPGTPVGTIATKSIATGLHGETLQHSTVSGTTANVQIGSLRLSFSILSNLTFFPLDSSTTGWKMVRSGDQWVLTSKSGEEYRFAPHSALPAQRKRLISRQSADGHKLSYSYDGTARLTRVDSNRGYRVNLQYSGTTVTVCGFNLSTNASASGCSGALQRVIYTRDSSSRVTSITGVDNTVVGIQYLNDQSGVFPSCVTLPNSATCRVQNTYYRLPPGQTLVPGHTRFDHVIEQTTAEGEVWNYTHAAVEDFPEDYTPYPGEIRQSYSGMTPPASGPTSFTFGNGFIEEAISPSGRIEYEYSSNATYQVVIGGNLSIHYYSIFPSKVTYPEGNSVSFTRDWADNVTARIERAKPGSGLANNTTVWIYPTSYKWSVPSICAAADVLCDKPTKIIDPNGNATDITYNGTHGGVLTRTGPADNNGVRPQTRYTYTQRFARNANGTALSPAIWVLASEEYCISSAASGSGCAGGAADEVVTTYDYGPTSGPNNLLLRGTAVTSGGQTLRTCYRYDNLGRKIAETQPKGTGSVCP